jgi:hypothetical protein
MGKRYSISGSNSAILNGTVEATGSTYDPTALMGGQYALGRAVTTGRKFYLRGISVHNPTTAVPLALYDATAGAHATTATRKMVIQAASGNHTKVEFAAPGLRFQTGLCIARESTAASGSFGPGRVTGWGYEEE